MYYNDHKPPHIHAEYQGAKALFDFQGNIIRGGLGSRTAIKLVREWIDFHGAELEYDWSCAKEGKDIKRIEPLE